MNQQERTVWGLHAGRTGDIDRLFHHGTYRIALGWSKVSNLTTIASNGDAFKLKSWPLIPTTNPERPRAAGQLFRFVHEMQVDDLVVHPSKIDKQIHIGEVAGDYMYDPGREPAIRTIAR